MKCPEIHTLFTDYAEKSLDPHRLTILKNHLTACQECGQHWQEFQQTVHLVQNLEPVSPPPDLLTGIMARLEKKSFLNRLWQMIDRVNFSMSVPAAVTTFVIAMVGGFLLKNVSLPEPPQGTALYSMDRSISGQERLARMPATAHDLVAVSQGNKGFQTNPATGMKALAAHPIPYENLSRPLSPDMRILLDCDREKGGRLSLYEEMLRVNWRLFQPAGDVLLIHLPQEDLPYLHALLADYSFQLVPAAAASRHFARDKKILTAVIRFQ